AVTAFLFPALLAAQPAPRLEASRPLKVPTLTYERYTLPNGLTVLLHEDHRLPLVAVDLWYHVGPLNERPGRTGFAHLFEHMMFEGSQHVGELALWLESDRMGFLLEGLDRVKLTNQRDVVRNERRQGEGTPYDVADEQAYHMLLPQQHP